MIRIIQRMLPVLVSAATVFADETGVVAKASARAEKTPVPATNAPSWQSDLSDLGVVLDPEATKRAMILASVQTVDAKAHIITSNAWQHVQDARSGWAMLGGFSVTVSNGQPVIAEAPDDGEASTNAVLAGDIIIGIGTNRIDRITLARALAMLRSDGATNQLLTIVRGSETNALDVPLSRQKLPVIETADLLPNGVGYIKVNGLFAGAGPDLVSRIRAWSETKQAGLVLDVRGAGGDDLASVAQVASLYAQGTQALFSYRDHHTNEVASFKASESRTVEMPLMVLIDGGTHGAAETLVAVLNHVARPSVLIGEATAGDFLLREAVELEGHQVYMATKVLNTADGLRYNGQFGVTPDLLLADGQATTHDYDPPENLLDRRQKIPEEAAIEAVRRRVRGDAALERAVDILIGLKTLHGGASEVSLPSP